MKPILILAAALLLGLAAPSAAQTPAPLDTARVELVRSRGMARAADTQLTKTLDLYNHYLGHIQTGWIDSVRTELVRSRAFLRGSDTQLTKVLGLVDRAAAAPVLALPIDALHRAVATLPADSGWARITVDSAGVVLSRDSLWLGGGGP